MKLKNRSTRIGELLIHTGIITEDTLNSALRIQNAGTQTNLGEILLSMKACTQEDIDFVIDKQDKLRDGGLDFLDQSQDTVSGHIDDIKEMSNGILGKTE